MKLDREFILARSPMRLNRFCVSVINKLFKVDKRPPFVTTSKGKPVAYLRQRQNPAHSPGRFGPALEVF